jgi:hypothetical protein
VSPREVVIALLCQTCVALALAGLVLRGRSRTLRSFTVYLAVVLVSEFAVLLWPAVFWSWNWWLARQITYSSLKLAIGAELAVAVFAAFPGARRTASVATFGLLVLTLAFLAMPTDAMSRTLISGQLLPRLGNGALGVFVGLAAVARWYVVPLNPFHKAILSGFVAYGVLIVTVGALVDLTNEPTRLAVSLVAGTGYATLTAWWAVSAWMVKDPNPAETPLLAALEARC